MSTELSGATLTINKWSFLTIWAELASHPDSLNSNYTFSNRGIDNPAITHFQTEVKLNVCLISMAAPCTKGKRGMDGRRFMRWILVTCMLVSHEKHVDSIISTCALNSDTTWLLSHDIPQVPYPVIYYGPLSAYIMQAQLHHISPILLYSKEPLSHDTPQYHCNLIY